VEINSVDLPLISSTFSQAYLLDQTNPAPRL
jgi:hypothetical protein